MNTHEMTPVKGPVPCGNAILGRYMQSWPVSPSKRLPPGVGDPQPCHLHRPPAGVDAPRRGAVVASFPGSASVVVWPGMPGTLTISVARDITEAFEIGRYTDKLRVTLSGLRSMMWTGQVEVGANLWSVL